MEAGRAVFRTGTSKDTGKPYRFVSARVRAYRDDKGGEFIDPRTIDDDAKLATLAAESHSVALDPIVWNGVASAATVMDKVYLTGTLVVGENDKEDHFYAATINGKTVLSGDLTDPKPCGYKPDTTFPCGKLPKWEELPVDAK